MLSPDEFPDSEAMLRLLFAREWFWEAAVLAPRMCEGTTSRSTTMKAKYLVTSKPLSLVPLLRASSFLDWNAVDHLIFRGARELL